MTESEQLSAGSVLRQGETLYIVERGPTNAGDVVVGQLGDRKVKPEYMFDLGDDCPVPGCDGEVVESSVHEKRRQCSEGCLEWLIGRPVSGQDCPSCGEGEVVNKNAPGDKYTLVCSDDDCGWLRGGVQRWREAWWPNAKERVLEELRSAEECPETVGKASTGTDQEASR